MMKSRVKYTRAELTTAELAFCHVVMGLKGKPKKKVFAKTVTKWIRASPDRRERFDAPYCTPCRRDQSVVAIYRWWRSEEPAVLAKFSEPALPMITTKPPSAPGTKKRYIKVSTGTSYEQTRDEFYKSWDWRTIRMEVLKERGRRCECCGATPAGTDMNGNPVRICVDHIKPLARHWHLRLDKTNLQILCDECNQGKGAWDETDWRGDVAA